MDIRCAGCTGENAAVCEENFQIAREAITELAEQTVSGGLKRLRELPDGSLAIEALDTSSEAAWYGNHMLRGIFVGSLERGQDALGCTLTRELIELKVSTVGE